MSQGRLVLVELKKFGVRSGSCWSFQNLTSWPPALEPVAAPCLDAVHSVARNVFPISSATERGAYAVTRPSLFVNRWWVVPIGMGLPCQ